MENGHAVIITTQEDLSLIVAAAVRAALGGVEQVESKQKKMISPKEIQQEYGINRRTLEHWRLQGIGPAYTNFGRRVFYDRVVFEKFIAAGNVQTTGWVDR
ncbi:AlpA family transcriptional regulator [Desulfovibrio sp.]|uniref:helix-turn-helix transcriptional regulator n=1 Tax=Desulfovibrio sp. TaxID=885 RepID=UPI0025C1E15A|nr:helix-turn-helix domain-containing protein [Desulfovibrio sp.]